MTQPHEVSRATDFKLTAMSSASIADTLLALHPGAIAILDRNFTCRRTNPAWNELARQTGMFPEENQSAEDCPALKNILHRITDNADSPMKIHLESPEGDQTAEITIHRIPPKGRVTDWLVQAKIQGTRTVKADPGSRYKDIMDSIQAGFFETDMKGRVRCANSRMAEFLNRPIADIIGTPIDRILPDSAVASFTRAMIKIREHGTPVRIPALHIGTQSRTVVLEMGLSLMRREDGTPEGIRCINRDISLQYQAEEEKRMLSEQLQHAQRLEAIGTLAGGIAHDFNNLLMGIQGNISLIQMATDPEHKNYARLEKIESQIRRGANLTQQLLGFSRNSTTAVSRVHMGKLVSNTVSLFGRTRKEIRIEAINEPGPMPVDVNAGQVEQALLNLFVNAWQAMPDGGRITVTTAPERLSDTFTEAFRLKGGTYIHIAVSDTGTGMDEQTRKRIFNPFFTTREMGKGTGLGLTSTYSIVKNHKGFITVESDVGQGTTFHLYFPAAGEIPARKAAVPANRTRNIQTILVADDEEIVLEVAAEMLTELGYSVETAHDGQEVIDKVKRHSDAVDLVLLDLIMPNMKAGDIVHALLGIRSDIRILLASGYSRNEHVDQLLALGNFGFVQKPYSMKDLQTSIQKILES